MKLGIARATYATSDAGLAGRLAWITGLRLGFLTLVLVVIAFVYLGGGLEKLPLSLRVIFGTIAAGFALAEVYAALLRRGKNLRRVAEAQLVFDQLTWTIIVYVTGGATSGATSFYALTCLAGAVLIGSRGAGYAAALGVAAYALLCAAFGFQWIRPPHDQIAASYATRGGDLVYPLLLNALGITVVALLAGYLAERLRLTGGALEEATQRALDAERLAVLGRVAAGLAHEIRNPLGSIRGSVEMLREAPALTDEDRRLCDIIQRESLRLNALVGDMMDLAKPKPPRAEAVDVAALARDVVSLAGRSSERAEDVKVVYAGPAGLVMGRCDAAQMRQVVWNLVRNAIQASSAGSTVTVRVAPHGAEVLLSVDDEGAGIAPEELDRIFEAFYTTRSHGAGIGLAVVKRIMDEHAVMGASIRVTKPERGGASFEIRLRTDVTGLRTSLFPQPSPR